VNRLLIVDDESIIVNGLVDLFVQQDMLPLEVYGAHSAAVALKLLSQIRMDIVITDIGMPEMDGLELQKRINQAWPQCKVIILTGFSEFQYIRDALRNQGIDYVLKGEGDEVIFKAVEKAIELNKEEVKMQELIAQAGKQLRQTIPLLQKEFLQHILQGDLYSISRLAEHFAELQIPLHADHPVMLVLVRVDSFREEYSIYDRNLLVYSIQNVAQEYLQSSLTLLPVELNPSRMLWFIQPKIPASNPFVTWADSKNFLMGSLELIQQTCKDLLGTPLSFILQERPTPWPRVSDVYGQCTKWMSRGLGLGSEFLWVYQEKEEKVCEPKLTSLNDNHLGKQLDQLRLYLQNGQKENFETVLSDILLTGFDHANEPRIEQEIYYSLVPIFLSHMNRYFSEEVGYHSNINKLTSLEAHTSWGDITDFFKELSSAIFAEKKVGMEHEENVVINKVQKYIQHHLDGDLSLVRIGDVVGHNSKYLSRLYKKSTGEDLSSYISRTKLVHAQTMLQETSLKIYEISSAVGFLSEPYFYRFFRKATGMTPQEYREIHSVDRR